LKAIESQNKPMAPIWLPLNQAPIEHVPVPVREIKSKNIYILANKSILRC